MFDLSDITEAQIIRDLQPNDVIVFSVPDRLLSMEYAHRMKEQIEADLGCKVLIKADSITLEQQSCDA